MYPTLSVHVVILKLKVKSFNTNYAKNEPKLAEIYHCFPESETQPVGPQIVRFIQKCKTPQMISKFQTLKNPNVKKPITLQNFITPKFTTLSLQFLL